MAVKLSEKVSRWFKKINFFEFFQYALGVFPSSFLIRAGDRLRRSYKQTTKGEMSNDLAKKLGSNSISKQKKTAKQQNIQNGNKIVGKSLTLI